MEQFLSFVAYRGVVRVPRTREVLIAKGTCFSKDSPSESNTRLVSNGTNCISLLELECL